MGTQSLGGVQRFGTSIKKAVNPQRFGSSQSGQDATNPLQAVPEADTFVRSSKSNPSQPDDTQTQDVNNDTSQQGDPQGKQPDPAGATPGESFPLSSPLFAGKDPVKAAYADIAGIADYSKQNSSGFKDPFAPNNKKH